MDTEAGSLVELGLALKLGNGEALDPISSPSLLFWTSTLMFSKDWGSFSAP